jgi:hypothetical protein
MLVVDACYNGGGRTGEGVLTGGRRLVVPNYAAQADVHATEWAATAPQELSAPLTAVSHGAFTYFAVGALRGWADGEVDGSRDGNVTAEEANKYVTRSLRAVQTQGQTPQLSTTDASKLILARGVKELGPGREDLALLRGGAAVVSVPVPVPRTGDAVVQTDGKDMDFAELARRVAEQEQAVEDEKVRAAAAAKVQAEKEAAAQALKDELARRLAVERQQKLDAAASDLQASASRDYAAISELVASPSKAGQPVLEAWLARYGAAKVSVDGVSQAVLIVEADRVRAAIRKLNAAPPSTVAVLDNPTVSPSKIPDASSGVGLQSGIESTWAVGDAIFTISRDQIVVTVYAGPSPQYYRGFEDIFSRDVNYLSRIQAAFGGKHRDGNGGANKFRIAFALSETTEPRLMKLFSESLLRGLRVGKLRFESHDDMDTYVASRSGVVQARKLYAELLSMAESSCAKRLN